LPVLVRLSFLASVRPSLDVRGIYGDGLSEAWQRLIEFAGEGSENSLYKKSELRLGKLGAEAGESRLAGQFI